MVVYVVLYVGELVWCCVVGVDDVVVCVLFVFVFGVVEFGFFFGESDVCCIVFL